MRKGLGVSPGVVIGHAYCIHEIFVSPDTKRLADDEVVAELQRYERARDRAAADLRALYQKVAAQVGTEQAAIFQTHEAILHDPGFTAKVRAWIVDERQTAESALHHLLDEYSQLFERMDDVYLRERLTDVRDVILRLSEHLSPMLETDLPSASGSPVIVVAEELLPSQAIALGSLEVAGIVTQGGGETSHAAILARKRGIPAVAGVRGILKLVKNGDLLIVDGRSGHVIQNPDTETISAYRKLEREYFDLRGQLAENRHLPARTADGVPIDLLANINNLEDAQTAADMGATGVGLYRTEYLFLTHHDVPDEDEQRLAYEEIIAASPGRRVTVRTLDLGGDKTVAYLARTGEANPFMGWRSIRLSFEHPDFFQRQIRAVLRAAGEAGPDARVQLMFPMITTLEEMRKVKAMVSRARRQLAAAGLPVGQVPIGMMIEVPAAAVCIDSLLEVVDFVSIGSNDLVQYLMAADRDNPKVSHLCQPLSPAVLRVLSQLIAACNEAAKPVTLCGEMAGRPRAFILLLGMGLRSFSMSPAFIPSIKDLARHVTVAEAREILDRALRMKTTQLVRRFMTEQIERLAPNLKLLEGA